MEALYTNFFDYILHFDRYLPLVMEQYGHWIYAILFTIVFCETGLVVTPFLPGDSLLFACGALAATAGGLDLTTLVIIFLVSAILGDACNYMIGEEFGQRILRNHPKLIKPQHIQKAEAFYAKHLQLAIEHGADGAGVAVAQFLLHIGDDDVRQLTGIEPIRQREVMIAPGLGVIAASPGLAP